MHEIHSNKCYNTRISWRKRTRINRHVMYSVFRSCFRRSLRKINSPHGLGTENWFRNLKLEMSVDFIFVRNLHDVNKYICIIHCIPGNLCSFQHPKWGKCVRGSRASTGWRHAQAKCAHCAIRRKLMHVGTRNSGLMICAICFISSYRIISIGTCQKNYSAIYLKCKSHGIFIHCVLQLRFYVANSNKCVPVFTYLGEQTKH